MKTLCVGCGEPIRFWNRKAYLKHGTDGAVRILKVRFVGEDDYLGPYHRWCAYAFRKGYNHRWPVP